MRPSYKTNDPKGWCGDPRRGAALGRSPILKEPVNWNGKLYLSKVRLSGDGYDPNGTYFGWGTPIWWYANEEGTIDATCRAGSRREAKVEALKLYPHASFFR